MASRPGEAEVEVHRALAAEAHDEVALADEAVLVEIRDRIHDGERHDEARGHERSGEAARTAAFAWR
jgi:hypothetical protein